MTTDDLAIAVVGMAVRLPGAATLDEYWDLLLGGRITATRSGEIDGDFVPSYGTVAGSGHFDPDRFGISEAEAVLIDPQQRLLLDVADEALADANADPSAAPVSIYAGVGRNDYLDWVSTALAGRPGVDDMALEVANGGDYAATRVAYRLGLTGTALTVQSACSTGLVAVHLACQDLLGAGSDVAVAATSAVRVPGPRGYTAAAGGIGSPDGCCRPFDRHANGTLPGDGAGAVVLKRLADAIADGDRIWGVIRGSATNNDGSVKSGFAGVNSQAQRDVVLAALDVAGVEPHEISYVEAHGSGTRVGDAAEWSALAEVFEGTGQPVAVGAVKANLGHLREAAGIAGIVKTLLSLHHGKIVPTPSFTGLPEDLARRSGTLAPVADVLDWTAGVRRAGVSAFGLGGTNCHVVLETAPPRPAGEARTDGLLLLSSHSARTLDEDTEALRDQVVAAPERVGDLAFTTQTSGRKLRERRYVVVSADEDPAEAFAAGRLRGQTATAPRSEPGIGFVLPGIGSHYQGMGAGLAARNPIFAGHLDGVLDHADELTGGRVSPRFAPDGRAQGKGGDRVDLAAMLRRKDKPARSAVDLPELHLSLFCFEYALARTLVDHGLRPSVLIGHSLGEWVCSVLADVIDVETAMVAVHRRAGLVKLAGEGHMLAVLASAEEVAGYAGDDAWLAADNGPKHCVFSGRPGGIARLSERLRADGFSVLPVDAMHPFHTPQLEDAARLLGDDLTSVEMRAPKIPLASSVLGRWLGPDDLGPAYWRRHMVDTVHFRDAAKLALTKAQVLVEVGPGTARPWVLQADPSAVVVRTVRQSYEQVSDTDALLAGLGQLWANGVRVDFGPLHAKDAMRVQLPRPSSHRRRFLPDQPPPQRKSFSPSTEAPAEPRQVVAVEETGVDELERHLRAQWRALLGLREVHPDDHFFHLGGDSLMGVHLIAGLREVTGVQVPSEQVFAFARFGAMVTHLRGWLAGEPRISEKGTDCHG
ncbi:type I polyketide synthase [Lentzea sp. CA-135723]|uniref:type I polyketide synthase n=1 Tax=Lentzea sp. CA-135723 TaxID=3239950 RepID=UPI003D8B51DD